MGKAAVLAAALTVAAAPSVSSGAPAPVPAPPITLELNKLEPLGQGGCRAYVVVANPDARAIQRFNVDLVLFGGDGIIARRIGLDLAPLPARKTSVLLFDLEGLACNDLGQVLVNDVLVCQIDGDSETPADQQRRACLDRLAVSSRAKAPLTK